jgi:hypothetical protein
MAIKKNEVTTNLKINKSLLPSKKYEKKVGRKSFNDEKLKADKRNTFLLNFYQTLLPRRQYIFRTNLFGYANFYKI